jgi:cytoskeletal protein RodZ
MSIGETLATARADAGLSVEDVSRETRIRGGLIRAIEADDFGHCGGDVYARGHIRSIAAVVGIDGGPLVAEYDRINGGAPQPVENPTPSFDPTVAQRAERRRPNWAAGMAAALVIICLIAVVQLANGSNSNQPQAGGTPQPTTSSAPQSAAPSPGPEPSGAVALVPQSGVNVRVRLLGKSWLHVVGASGQVLFEGILGKGTQRDFADPRRIRMTIGNAGAVALIVNGRDIGVAGKNGQVSHKSFEPGSSTANAG